MTIYTGDFHREGDVWVAEVREVPQAHTYGRTLARTKDYLRDALALYLNVAPDTVDIIVRVEGPDDVAALVDTAIRTRQEADLLNEQARVATSQAAVALVHGAGLSYRDAAAALGLSHQRVEQLLSDAAVGTPKKPAKHRKATGSRREQT